MRSHTIKGVALLALAAALIWGCESSDVLAPSGSQISIEANPTTVEIDVDAGETEGRSRIEARLFDSTSTFPLEGIDVTFTSSGGTLARSDNSCTTRGTCRLSGGSCSIDVDCPAIPLQTDANGEVRDELILTVDDSAPVEVTVTSAMATASVSVDKSETNSAAPNAQIDASPADAQAKNRWVTFAAVEQDPVDPEESEVTCYQWTITSPTIPGSNEVIQNSISSSVVRRYADEQNLTVTLRVSDRNDADSFCVTGGAPADASEFNAEDSIAYEIVCDLTGPVANAGADQNVTLAGTTVSVTLNGSGSSDTDSGITTYSWSCGNGTPDQDGQVVTCEYATATNFTARLSVTNGCREKAFDDVTIRVLSPNP